MESRSLAASRAGTTPAGHPENPVEAEIGHPRRWLILVVLCGVAFMAQLDLFVVNLALPSMASSFHGSGLTSLSWVLNAYSVVFAALLVPAGRLADHYGRRRFLLAGVLVFAASSALCAVAPDLAVLIVGRAVQAVGAAVIVPTSLGLLLPAFAKRQHSLVVGIWAGVAAVAASAGPPVGGLLVEANWRWIFLINVPIGLGIALVGSRVLPEVRGHLGARLPDAVSTVAVFLAIALLTLATVQGSDWGWASAGELGLLAGFAVFAAISVYRIVTHPRALIEAALFRSREFTAAMVVLVLFYMSFAAFLLISVLFFQDVWHYGTLRTGLALVPGPVMSAVFALNSGRLTAWFGRRALAVAGMLFLTGAGLFWLLATPAQPAYLTGFLPGMLMGGIGSGLTQAPLFASSSTLPPERATTGSAVLNMSRQVGSALGVAVLVALLASAQPHLIGEFRRGWLFIVVTSAVGAVLTIAGLRPPRTTVPRRSAPRIR